MDLTDTSARPEGTGSGGLSDELRTALGSVSVETLVHQLQKRGITSTFLTGLHPLVPTQRMVGRALTLRFVPYREDQESSFMSGTNAQRRAVEAAGPGDVLVIDARGVPDAGTIGDLFVLRLLQRGAAGVVTDGALRDAPAIRELGLPVYHQAAHAATFRRRHLPHEVGQPVACGGVLVVPGDVVVGDGGGCTVVPFSLAAEVAQDAVQQELEETWAAERLRAGESTAGVFPLSAARRPEFEAWAAARACGPTAAP
ncbi:hypothetical protein AB2L27_10305 [Kineococcus sp. LSe6-4]|uniref:Putative 4-hydroxy-4-methyl-2-oxoglutarate aldolase n=1 Tax=Kineococcus halophytocola TaxID=3234027 RepID=A0ABV4H385_9ACTN